jgi:hypothetical protein
VKKSVQLKAAVMHIVRVNSDDPRLCAVDCPYLDWLMCQLVLDQHGDGATLRGGEAGMRRCNLCLKATK